MTTDQTDTARSAEFRAQWSRKLGRLRLGVEPLDDQLDRITKTTAVLTAVASGVGLSFVGLFTAFGRPLIGLTVAAVILTPWLALAWVDVMRLRARVGAYRRALAGFEATRRSHGHAGGGQ